MPLRCLLPLLLLQIACSAEPIRPCNDCTTTLPDGSVYDGPLEHGLLDGFGTLTWPDGDSYRGEFANGRMSGEGTYTDVSGNVFTGTFADGTTVGRGVIEYVHGQRYEGEWRDWSPDGAGTWTSDNGDVFTGTFEQGALNGPAEITLQSGDHYVGDVEWWSYQGQGTLESARGRYTGEFAAGRYHGDGTLFWRDDAGVERTIHGSWADGYYVGPDRARYVASGHALPDAEALLYRQPALLQRAVAGLQTGTPGRSELYVVSFAADGTQDVFRKEAAFAQQTLDDLFGTASHRIALVNNPRTLEDAPLATSNNLALALDAVGTAMDPQEDVLLLFLTGHGSADHELSVRLAGATLNDLSPDELRRYLDEAGIRWRVIVVSACYSGGFIAPLRDDHTMIITSARSDRRSFGCSDDAELTYFGRAFFEAALPAAASFEEAFFTARGVVARRELAEGYEPSEPQLHTTRQINRKLIEVQRPTVAGHRAASNEET